jgi:hypothetical protein
VGGPKLLTQRLQRAGKGEGDVTLTRHGRTFVAWESRDGTVLTKLGPGLGPVWRAVLPQKGTAPMVAAGGRGVSTASNASRRRFDRIWRFPD